MNENRDPNDRLQALSDRLADGESIPWADEERAHPDMAGRLRALQLIEQLTAANRAQQDDPAARWGPLRIEAKVASTRFAEVYRAFDPTLQREVALKLLSTPSEHMSQTQWLAEARRMARVRHPNVLLVFDAAVHDGRAGIWSEFLEGRTLEDQVREDGVLSASEVALIALDLCRALAAVHAAKLVHGDVKAANVMRESGGRIVLMDFGSAEPSGGESAGLRTASPLYCAPEVLRGETPNAQSDVYSLGVLLFWLLSGEFPFSAADLDALRVCHGRDQARPLRELRPELPSAFVAIVERAVAVDPAHRPSSCAELERNLSGFLTGERAGSGTPSVIRRGWLVLASLVLMVGAVWLWPKGVHDPFETVLFAGSQLRVRSELMRLRDGVRIPLSAGATLAPNDHLSMSLRSDADAYVYVLNEDRFGELFVLFPIEGVSLQNPLRRGTDYLLPGESNGRPQDWIVTSAGGHETFLAIASKEPLGDLEERIARWNQASRDGRRAAPSTDLRGVGRIADAVLEANQSMVLRDLVRELQESTGSPEGLWAKMMTYPNPSPTSATQKP
ncbi:MAG TPA: serine/threonine-protein kinase [Candidatus Krumholzibacteria bacterium]|jgi:hypothetical protein